MWTQAIINAFKTWTQAIVNKMRQLKLRPAISYIGPPWFVKWILGFIVFSNLAVTLASGYFINGDHRFVKNERLNVFIAILVWLAIPVAALVISLVQSIQCKTGRLGAVSIVAVGVFCTLMWVIYACMGRLTDLSGNRYWPWLALSPSGFFLNIAYLSIGAHAVRRHNQGKSDGEVERATASTADGSSLETLAGKPPSYSESEFTIFSAEEEKATG